MMKNSQKEFQHFFLIEILMCCVWALFAEQTTLSQNTEKENHINFKRINQLYRCEPHVNEVIEKALAKATVDPTEVEGLVSRARHRGWIPSLRFGVRRGQGNDQSAQYLQDEDRTNFSIDNTLVMDGTLTFDFGRVLFAREEISFFREKKNLKSLRTKLIEKIATAYFERRRLQIEQELMTNATLEKQIRIWEIEAFLDSVTNQEFKSQWQCAQNVLTEKSNSGNTKSQ